MKYTVIRIRGGAIERERGGWTRSAAARARYALAQVPGPTPYLVEEGEYATAGSVRAAALFAIPRPASAFPEIPDERLNLRAVGYQALAADLVSAGVEDIDYMLSAGLIYRGRVVEGHPGWTRYNGIRHVGNSRVGAETLLALMDGTLDGWLRDAGYAIHLDAVRERAGLPLRPTPEDIAFAMWDCLTIGQRAKLPRELYPPPYRTR